MTTKTAGNQPVNMLLRGGRITRWKGRVASLSPHFGALAGGVSLTAFATALLLSPTDAQAGNCVAEGTTTIFVCIGPATGADKTQDITSSPVTVSTTVGFGIETPVGDAISIRSLSDVLFTDGNYSTISGKDVGLYVRNYGVDTSSVSITTNGLVKGDSRAIFARTFAMDLTVSAANATGGQDGVVAFNYGSGKTSITTTGMVAGARGAGIYGYNDRTATDLIISSTGIVTGKGVGIIAASEGIGAVTITATKTVIGDVIGIVANNSGSSGTDVTVSAADTTGISASNSGTGSVMVSARNSIANNTNFGSIGIDASNSANGKNLTVSAHDTEGESFGIVALSGGKGELTITTTGTATATGIAGMATGYDGIYAATYGNATNAKIDIVNATGGRYGLRVRHMGTGFVNVKSTGSVIGSDAYAGISVSNTKAGSDLRISTADVTGGRGINSINDPFSSVTITSTGTVIGTMREGIYAKSSGNSMTIRTNNVMGFSSGIHADNRGTATLSITSNGLTAGTNKDGIYAFNRGTDLLVTVTDAWGGDNGLNLKNNGNGRLMVDSMGAAAGGTIGISAINSLLGTDLIVKANTSSGGFRGISATNGGRGALTITSTGMATGTNAKYGYGIYGFNTSGTDLTIAAVGAMGGKTAISAKNNGNGRTSVTVSGAITGGVGAGISTQSNPGAAVAIDLLSTAIVGTSAGGSGVAIMDGVGNATVTINAGAVVNGSIVLGDGNDRVDIPSGTSLAGVTRLSGDEGAMHSLAGAPVAPLAGLAGDVDTLNIGADFAGALDDFEIINLDIGSGSFTLGSVISNVTSLTKRGAGTATLSGISTFTAPTMVTGGTLNVTGMIASSPVTVMTGGTLGGTGTVGTVMAQSGGTVAPGSAAGAIGTLKVNGNLTLAAGSTLAVDISPMSQGSVSVTGAAMLDGNLVITPSAAMGFGSNITILSANSVTGTFASTMIAGPFGAAFAPKVVINGATVMLQLAPTSLGMLAGPGLRPNALAFATAFDAAVTAGFNPQAFMGLFTQGANTAAALDQFTGEIHSAERRVALEDTRIVREAVFDRLSGDAGGAQSVSTEDGDMTKTLWMQGVASTSKAQDDGIGRRFTSDRTGFLFGGDIATSSGFRFGGLFSYVDSDVDLARIDKAKVRSVGGAIYAGYRQPGGSGFALGGGASIADARFKDRRSITVPGVVQSLTSRYGGTTYQLFGEISYDLATGEGTRIEPFARAAYAKLDAGGFTEGGGVAAVKATKQGNDLTTTSVGLRGAYTIGQAVLSGSAAYQHVSGDRSAPTDLSVAGVTNPFRIRSVALDRDAAALEAQASFRLAPRVTLGIGYSGVIGSKNTDHGGRGTLTFAW